MIVKGILFDLDGTLADTLDDIAGSMNRVLQEHGYPAYPVNEYKLLVGRGLDNLVAQALPSEAREPDVIAQCLNEFTSDYDRNCLVKTSLYPGIRSMLEEMIRMGIPMAVFSNKAEPLTRKIVEGLMASMPFAEVKGARSGYPKKPDPAGALEISRLMNIPPEAFIYVGDSDVDMITAKRAGMFAVGVSWGFRSKQELLNYGARAIADHPHELVEIVR